LHHYKVIDTTPLLYRMLSSSWMSCCVTLIRNGVSGKCIISIIRMKMFAFQQQYLKHRRHSGLCQRSAWIVNTS
jgi:hypothetical protein